LSVQEGGLQDLTQDPNFGKPENGYDLFHGTNLACADNISFSCSITGTKNESRFSICKNGFDDHYFKTTGWFGPGQVSHKELQTPSEL
jgi:hypothetical protein